MRSYVSSFRVGRFFVLVAKFVHTKHHSILPTAYDSNSTDVTLLLLRVETSTLSNSIYTRYLWHTSLAYRSENKTKHVRTYQGTNTDECLRLEYQSSIFTSNPRLALYGLYKRILIRAQQQEQYRQHLFMLSGCEFLYSSNCQLSRLVVWPLDHRASSTVCFSPVKNQHRH